MRGVPPEPPEHLLQERAEHLRVEVQQVRQPGIVGVLVRMSPMLMGSMLMFPVVSTAVMPVAVMRPVLVGSVVMGVAIVSMSVCVQFPDSTLSAPCPYDILSCL
ncbi:hypothetical protein GCM10022419_088990 [Nonomuraea rosea]|uniref:Uncharacterized protein n=1 Tax=Nonomuraea rosea TaxID=638574 RepID=A0ABP6YZD6_9ACTN